MFQLNYRDTRPFYEQIKDSIRQMVVTHAIKENEKLPSVRELASSLAINPNTIQRAYRELESEGYIYSIAGKGSFVAEEKSSSNHRSVELLQKFDSVVTELLFLSVPARELTEHIQRIEKGGTHL